MVIRIASAAAGVSLVLAGCGYGPVDPIVCPSVVSRAIEAELRDAHSGKPAAAGALGIAREGSYADTLRVVGWTSHPSAKSAYILGGADERPGLYTVRIE